MDRNLYPVVDQCAETITRLLIENIVCRHGVPEDVLSDRGMNFLSDLILEMCSLLGIRKVNMSGYHPQTDGLVEKFNSTITNMISKSIDISVEWDKWLPLLLFAYRTSIQESTRESPFLSSLRQRPTSANNWCHGASSTYIHRRLG